MENITTHALHDKTGGVLLVHVQADVRMPETFPALPGVCSSQEPPASSLAFVLQTPQAHADLVAGLRAGCFEGAVQLYSGDDRYANVAAREPGAVLGHVPEFRGQEAALYTGLAMACSGSPAGSHIHMLLTSYHNYSMFSGPLQLEMQLHNELSRLEAHPMFATMNIHIWQLVCHDLFYFDDHNEADMCVYQTVLTKFAGKHGHVHLHAAVTSVHGFAQHMFGLASMKDASFSLSVGIPAATAVHHKVVHTTADGTVVCGRTSDPGFFKMCIKSKKPQVQLGILFIFMVNNEVHDLVLRPDIGDHITTKLQAGCGGDESTQLLRRLVEHMVRAEARPLTPEDHAQERALWVDSALVYADVAVPDPQAEAAIWSDPVLRTLGLEAAAPAVRDVWTELKLRFKTVMDGIAARHAPAASACAGFASPQGVVSRASSAVPFRQQHQQAPKFSYLYQ